VRRARQGRALQRELETLHTKVVGLRDQQASALRSKADGDREPASTRHRPQAAHGRLTHPSQRCGEPVFLGKDLRAARSSIGG
jgi:hypothetical protein